MKMKTLLFATIAILMLVISACGVSAPATEVMMDKETATVEAMMAKETPTAEAMMHDETATPEVMLDDAMMESPAWFNQTLTNVSTGETISIQGLKGKVILVETMAIWCPNCLKQQNQVKVLHETLGDRDDFLSIALDIDTNEDANSLKSYAQENGFDWFYAVSTADISRDIAAQYGDQFLNPPSTPILIIDRHGVAHPMPFGFKSADDLLKFIQPFLDESM